MGVTQKFLGESFQLSCCHNKSSETNKSWQPINLAGPYNAAKALNASLIDSNYALDLLCLCLEAFLLLLP